MNTEDVSMPEQSETLDLLRVSDMAPAEFWRRYLHALSQCTAARGVYLFIRDTKDEKPSWKNIARWPEASAPGIPKMEESLSTLLDRTREDGMLITHSTGTDTVRAGLLALDTGDQSSGSCVLLIFKDIPEKEVSRSMEKARLLADRPAWFRQKRTLEKARERNAVLSSILDLSLILSKESTFLSASMAVCNEMVSRFHCERVSLGWYHNGQVRLKAMSHSEKFEKKMELVRLMELAMEECVDQEEELVWPVESDQGQVTRDHERYGREAGSNHLCTVPLKRQGEIHAVLLFERESGPFTDDELLQLRLYADQIGPVIADLREKDRWFGARAYHGFRHRAAQLIGIRHTGWKLAGLVVAVLLGILLFGKMSYKVEAPFSLSSRNVLFITAPFDGYLKEAAAEVGDRVDAGSVLCRFDTQELLLEKAVTRSDYLRLVREAERRRADNELAEMRIIQAQAAQVEAELDRINYRLEQATIEAPFEAVVVEGDLREQVGSRFSTGEELYRLARLDELYAQVRVSEADIDEISEESEGELIFKSRPGTRFPVRISRVEPVAQTEESGNVFQVRAHLDTESEDWFRPGMSGIAKLDAGKRSILWILTHRTVDYLRLHVFWW